MLLLAMAATSMGLQAKTITVTAQANTPADYYLAAGQPYAYLSDLIASPDVAEGDVLMLTPGPTSYGNVTVSKGITIQGNGHYNQPEVGIVIFHGMVVNSSNVTIEGVKIGLGYGGLTVNNQQSNTGFASFLMRKCHINGGLTMNNAVNKVHFEGNLFSSSINIGANRANQAEVVFSNNLFTNNNQLTITKAHTGFTKSILFVNNTFIGNNYQNSSYGQVKNTFFVRNVFAGWQFDHDTQGNTFYHNVMTAATLPNGNTGSGADNLLGATITFENSNGNHTYDYGREDLRLTTSPYTGEVIGITDTYVPYGTPANPQINGLRVANPTVNQADPIIITTNGN